FFYTEALAGNSQGLLAFSYLPVLPCTMLLHIFRTSPTGAVLEPLLSLFKPPPTAPFRKGFGSLVTVG
ncbi:hypothetical protein, partial [Sphingobacterium multivorum]|uniref:hypothetical protein n=1 Tax=Sphingobacterium multivorum TaxID=28454 RepID=UPI002899F48D